MRTEKPIFAFHYEPDVVVLEPHTDLGELTYLQHQHDLRGMLRSPIIDQARNVIVDLRKAHYFGPSVMGLFVELWKVARQRQGIMVMSGVSPFGLEILRVARLDQQWPIVPTRADAIQLARRMTTQLDPCSGGCRS